MLVGRGVGGGDRAGLLEEGVEELVADRDQQVLLAGGVVVDAARRQAGRLAEVADRGLLVAALGEELRRRVDQRLAPALVAGAERGAGRRRRGGHREKCPKSEGPFENR